MKTTPHIRLPIAGAEITVNGEKTGIVTDEEGRFRSDLCRSGRIYRQRSIEHRDSCRSRPHNFLFRSQNLYLRARHRSFRGFDRLETTEVASTADVTRGTVEGDLANPKSGDSSAVVFSAAALVISCGALLVIKKK